MNGPYPMRASTGRVMAKRLKPFRPATDTGLLVFLAIVVVIVGAGLTGALDCQYQIISVGFC